MSPLESAMTLPCSDESMCASSSMLRFDQPLELEHHARAALRVGRGPAGWAALAASIARSSSADGAERHLRLHLALVGVEDVGAAARPTNSSRRR